MLLLPLLQLLLLLPVLMLPVLQLLVLVLLPLRAPLSHQVNHGAGPPPRRVHATAPHRGSRGPDGDGGVVTWKTGVLLLRRVLLGVIVARDGRGRTGGHGWGWRLNSVRKFCLACTYA